MTNERKRDASTDADKRQKITKYCSNAEEKRIRKKNKIIKQDTHDKIASDVGKKTSKTQSSAAATNCKSIITAGTTICPSIAVTDRATRNKEQCDMKKPFRIILPTKPEDFSSNWKQLIKVFIAS